MPVFLDTTKRRKYYFRCVVALIVALIIGCITLFFIGLSVSALSITPLSYKDTAERYHYYYGAASGKKIALTVDDGPNPDVAEDFFELFEKYDVPATFFYIGEKVLARPDLVKEAGERGFDVQSHSFTHGPRAHSSDQRFAFEVNTTGYLIEQATGEKPLFYRPPFLLGIGIDPTVNPYIPIPQDVLWSLERGYLPTGADIDPKDWLAKSSEEIIENFTRELIQTPDGHVVLLHETDITLEALPAIIEHLREEGYEIVSLKELLTPPAEIALTETLMRGSTDVATNGEVSSLQWFLYREGYLDPYSLTGVFDADTEEAVRNFQIQNGLDAGTLGTVGAATRSLVASISENVSSVPQAPSRIHPFTSLMAFVEPGLRSAYVNAFPVTRGFLVGMISFVLILVVARALAIITLLILSRRQEKPILTKRYSELPGVSVLIPAYNEENNITATIESVIRSTYPKREIIIIDDGSKDNTASEIRSVIDAHPHEAIQLVQVENGGKARALNIGLEHAHNSIVAVLDADAVMDPGALHHYVKHFNDPAVGAVAGRVRTTGNTSWLDWFQKLEYAVGQNIDKRAFSVIGAVGVVPGPAGAWRRIYLLELGGFKTDTLAEDQDMTLTLLRAGKKIVYEPEAIAYTETPNTITNFLKQRFRWVYGTMQCFWKHKGAAVEKPDSVLSVVVLPNVFVYNILLPLSYPFADSAFLFGLMYGEWRSLVLPFLLFTAFDIAYALGGIWKEPQGWRLLVMVPLQRVIYRPLLYYTVIKSVVRVLEGTGSSWNPFKKVGETRRFYLSALRAAPAGSIPSSFVFPAFAQLSESREREEDHSQVMPEDVITSFQGPEGTASSSTNLQKVTELPSIPRQAESAGDMSSPAWSPKLLRGSVASPKTYAKSSSPFGPTSSH